METLRGIGDSRRAAERWELALEREERTYLKEFRGVAIPFIAIFALLTVLVYTVTSPLFHALAWSALLSFFAMPLYRWFHRRVLGGHLANVAATLTTGAILLLIVLPAVGLGAVIANEFVRLYATFMENYLRAGGSFDIQELSAFLPKDYVAMVLPWFSKYPFLQDLAGKAGGWLAGLLADVSRGLLQQTLYVGWELVIIIVASFFMVRDGHIILDYIRDILPLPEVERSRFFERARVLLQSVIYGVTLTAAVQAMLGTLAWWYLGLPSPLLFGVLMFILAMIPFVGTPVLLLPGAAYLFFSGHPQAGLIMASWSLGVVSMVDNFIGPIFISEGSGAHILMVFMGVIGGLAAWGFLGLFLGPLVLALFIFLLDSYRRTLGIQRRSHDGPEAGNEDLSPSLPQ